VGTLALYAVPSVAQEIWIGRPTIGDYIRRDVQNLLNSYVELQRAGQDKVYLTQDIAKAREAFFATSQSPRTREEVGRQFAKLLQKKDLYYFGMYVTYGTDPQGIQRVKVLDAISKGAVDGGIHPEVLGDYLAWVNGFRASLGFSGDSVSGGLSSEALISQNHAAFAKAFKDNMPLYAKYQEARDAAEMDRFLKQRKLNQEVRANREKIANAKAPDGSYKLDNESTVPLGAHHIRGDRLSQMGPQWEARVRALAGARTPVLECHYGPIGMWEEGRLKFSTYTFWYGTVPAVLAVLADFFSVNNGALGSGKDDNLDKNIALPSCPSTEAQAVVIAASDDVEPTAIHDRGARSTTSSAGQPQPRESSAPGAEKDASGVPTPSTRADEHQDPRAASKARQCASLRASVGRARQAAAGVPPYLLARKMAQLARMEQSYAQQCGH